MSILLPQRPPQENLLQHTFDLYGDDIVDGVVPSSVGDKSRLPQIGRGYDFDEVDDKVNIPSFIDGGTTNPFAMGGWFYVPTTTDTVVFFNGEGGGTTTILPYGQTGGKFLFVLRESNTGPVDIRASYSNGSFPYDEWFHLMFQYNGGTDPITALDVYVNGVKLSKSSTSINGNFTQINPGHGENSIKDGTVTNSFKSFDVRTFKNTLLTQANIDDILAFKRVGNEFGFYKCEDTGLLAFDSSGNGNHGTKVNTDVLGANTFSYEGSDVPKSYQNEVGYSDGDGSNNNGLYIPRNESNPALDVLGNPLQYKGQVAYNAKLVESNGVKGNGVDQYIQTSGFVFDLNTDTSFTLTFWAKITEKGSLNYIVGANSATAFRIIIAEGGDQLFRIGVSLGNGGVRFLKFNQTDAQSFFYGQWVHYSVTYSTDNNGEIIFYRNNVLFNNNATIEYTGDLPITPSSLRDIWYLSTGGIGIGNSELTDLRLFTREINQLEVSQIYKGKTITNGVRYQYGCGEGGGSTLYDEIGDGNNATIFNGTTWIKQDVYHYNFYNGFSLYRHTTDPVTNPDIRVPLGIDPVLTNYTKIKDVRPSQRNHNGAETKVDFNPYNAPALSDVPIQSVENKDLSPTLFKRVNNNRDYLTYGRITNANKIFNFINNTYEPETIAYRNRVEADGGGVIDLDYVNSVYKKLKEFGILNNLKHWTSARAGIKRNVNNFISKTYSLLGNDGFQNTGSKQPILSANTINYDGVDDGLQLSDNLTDFNFIQNTGVFTANVNFQLNDYTETRVQSFLMSSNLTTAEKGFIMFYDNRSNIGINNRLGSSLVRGTSGSVISEILINNILNNNLKHNFTSTGDGNRAKTYLDGIEIGSTSMGTKSTGNNSRIMHFGEVNGTGRHFNGSNDNIYIFDITLAQAQISELNTL